MIGKRKSNMHTVRTVVIDSELNPKVQLRLVYRPSTLKEKRKSMNLTEGTAADNAAALATLLNESIVSWTLEGPLVLDTYTVPPGKSVPKTEQVLRQCPISALHLFYHAMLGDLDQYENYIRYRE
jgi:hypothetical protein